MSIHLSSAESPSPDWHAEVLAERRRLVEEGKLKFLDWEVAIEELKAEVRIR